MIAKPYLDGEMGLSDAIAIEQSLIFGPHARYYALNRASRDPLYGTPSNGAFEFLDPVDLPGVIMSSWDAAGDVDLETSDNGTTKNRTSGEMFIARALAEQLGLVLSEGMLGGDIIQVFTKDATMTWNPSLAETYDILKVRRAGQIGGSNTFTSWKLDVARRTDFTPERRLGDAR